MESWIDPGQRITPPTKRALLEAKSVVNMLNYYVYSIRKLFISIGSTTSPLPMHLRNSILRHSDIAYYIKLTDKITQSLLNVSEDEKIRPIFSVGFDFGDIVMKADYYTGQQAPKARNSLPIGAVYIAPKAGLWLLNEMYIKLRSILSLFLLTESDWSQIPTINISGYIVRGVSITFRILEQHLLRFNGTTMIPFYTTLRNFSMIKPIETLPPEEKERSQKVFDQARNAMFKGEIELILLSFLILRKNVLGERPAYLTTPQEIQRVNRIDVTIEYFRDTQRTRKQIMVDIMKRDLKGNIILEF